MKGVIEKITCTISHIISTNVRVTKRNFETNVILGLQSFFDCRSQISRVFGQIKFEHCKLMSKGPNRQTKHKRRRSN